MPRIPDELPSSVLERIAFLDGLRGVAILWVVLFHVFVRWTQIVPYGEKYADISWIAHGWLGVELFFMISGFVIFMTLERSKSLFEFLIRRWLRLFPAMLVCSILVYASAAFVPERPAGNPSIRDLLPGLTFIEPALWARVLRSPQGLIEGAFWSLFVEVKFYVIAGSCYFLVGAHRTVLCIIALFAYGTSVAYLVAISPELDLQRLQTLNDVFAAQHFGWFASGALFYMNSRTSSLGALVAAVCVGLFAAFLQQGIARDGMIFSLLTVALFASGVLFPQARWIFANTLLIFIGTISYPLYLIHENMIVALVVKIGTAWPWLPTWAMPIMPFFVVVILAWLVTKYVEPTMKRFLTRVLVAIKLYRPRSGQAHSSSI